MHVRLCIAKVAIPSADERHANKSGGRKPPVDHGNALAMTMLHTREAADAASANRIAITIAAATAG